MSSYSWHVNLHTDFTVLCTADFFKHVLPVAIRRSWFAHVQKMVKQTHKCSYVSNLVILYAVDSFRFNHQ